MKLKLAPAFLTGCLVVSLLLPIVSSAQTAATSDIMAARRAKLEADLATIEKEIAAQKVLLSSKQKETASISRDVAILDFKINTAKLNIKAKQIEIERLTTTISKKAEAIVVYSDRLDKECQSLSELLKKTREIDDQSVVEFVLAEQNLSKFFIDLDYFHAIQNSIQKSLAAIRNVRTETEKEKQELVIQRDAVSDAKAAIEAEKKEIEVDEKEKQRLLSISKSQEKQYKMVLAEKEARKQAIVSALFSLRGGNKAINFGQALAYARAAEKWTGVRAAFLMAILTQESNLGQNVGTCNRPGDPPSKSWQKVMKPGRDDGPFLKITAELGLDPNTIPVSCPLGGEGYGGAMGPAQFIPSTWMLYRNRIAQVTGHNPPNPWEPSDAFVASSLLLSDLGASEGGATAERRAALKYYAGGNWQSAKNAFYGNEVMAIAAKYEQQIKYLQDN
jgi:membrane-bound lytic murein transglycosylase B